MGRYVVTGAVLGGMAVLLTLLGNPAHTGLCVSCFMDNVAGALGLHHNVRMQYLRPELPGVVLGAALVARWRGDLKATAGSSPLLRFLVGNLLMIGCAVFMGCPIKLLVRLASGDVVAVAGAAGLAAGVAAGIQLVNGGFRAGRARPAPPASGLLMPAGAAVLAVLVFLRPPFLAESIKGAAAEHAPAAVSLLAGLILGGLAQPTRFCITAGLTRLFLRGGRELPGCPKSAGLLAGTGALLAVAFLTTVATGRFEPRVGVLADVLDASLWGFLGMALVGCGSVLARGCPFRQLVSAGQGDGDAGAAVLGMVSGAALVENWGLAGQPDGTPHAARLAVLVGLALLLMVALAYRDRSDAGLVEDA